MLRAMINSANSVAVGIVSLYHNWKILSPLGPYATNA